MELFKGDPSEIAKFIKTKKPTDQLTLAELGQLSCLQHTSHNNLRRVMAYLVRLGAVTHRKEGYFPTRKGLHPRAIALLDLAYLFFDPHPNLYRGIVVAKAGYDVKSRRRQRTIIEVLNPDGSVSSGFLLWPDYEISPSWRSMLQQISDQYEEGDIALVRRRGSFDGRNGTLSLFEPITSVSSEDNVTLNGVRIETKVDGNQIFYLPVIERVRGEYMGYGIGYANVEAGKHRVPVLIGRADDKVGSILPEVKILRYNRNFIVGEIR